MTDSSTSTGASPVSAACSPNPQRRPTAEEVSQFLGRWLGTMHSKPRADTGEPEAWVTTSMERLGYGVIAFLETLDPQNIRITAEPAPPADTTRQLEQAYKSGFMRCAQWADRSDLVADTDSAAYEKDRTADLSALTSEGEGSLLGLSPAFMSLPAVSAVKQQDLGVEADSACVEDRRRQLKIYWHIASPSELAKMVLTEDEKKFADYLELRGKRRGSVFSHLSQTPKSQSVQGANADGSSACESPGLLGIDHLQEAHRLGFIRCAGWAQRDDLISDVDSPAYLKDRDGDVAKVPENVARQSTKST